MAETMTKPKRAITIRKMEDLSNLIEKVEVSTDDQDLYLVYLTNGVIEIDAVSMITPSIWAKRLALISLHLGSWNGIRSDFADFSTHIKNRAHNFRDEDVR